MIVEVWHLQHDCMVSLVSVITGPGVCHRSPGVRRTPEVTISETRVVQPRRQIIADIGVLVTDMCHIGHWALVISTDLVILLFIAIIGSINLLSKVIFITILHN